APAKQPEARSDAERLCAAEDFRHTGSQLLVEHEMRFDAGQPDAGHSAYRPVGNGVVYGASETLCGEGQARRFQGEFLIRGKPAAVKANARDLHVRILIVQILLEFINAE